MSDPLSNTSLTCDQVQPLLFDLNEGEQLQTKTYDDVMAHVACCKACADYESDLGFLRESFQQIELTAVPDGLTARIMARVEALPGSLSQQATVDESIELPTAQKTTTGRFARFLRHNLTIAASFLVLAMGLTAAWQVGNFSLTVPMDPSAKAPDSVLRTQGASPAFSTVNNSQARHVGKTQTDLPNSIDVKASEGKQVTVATAVSHPQTATLSVETATQNTVMPQSQLAKHASTKLLNDALASTSTTQAEDSSDTHEQLAYAGNPSPQLNNTYASEKEDDVYYDPVSTLVGF